MGDFSAWYCTQQVCYDRIGLRIVMTHLGHSNYPKTATLYDEVRTYFKNQS